MNLAYIWGTPLQSGHLKSEFIDFIVREELAMNSLAKANLLRLKSVKRMRIPFLLVKNWQNLQAFQSEI